MYGYGNKKLSRCVYNACKGWVVLTSSGVFNLDDHIFVGT